MPWGAQTVETVSGGFNSARVNLLPGEWAHVQLDQTSGTERLRVRVLSTTEDDPGVLQLDGVPLLEFRFSVADGALSFVVTDVHAFVVAVDNDEDSDPVAAAVRVRKSTVDLSG